MRANELLLWLSARRQGTWQQFRNILDELDEASDNEDTVPDMDEPSAFPLSHRRRRSLEILGHVEFFTSGCESGWRVAPTALAGLETDGAVLGILCGARSVQLEERILVAAKATRIETVQQEEGPDALRFVAESMTRLGQVAAELGAVWQKHAPLALLGALPTVTRFVTNRAPTDLPLGADLIQRFSLSRLSWQASSREAATRARQDLFRFKLKHRQMYYLCTSGRAVRVPSEVGKYFLLWRRHHQVIEYRKGARHLIVPAICRPPMLVERALTLCSGILPRFEPRAANLTYGEIPEVVGRLASQVLCQEGR